jgi:hypothetical protein
VFEIENLQATEWIFFPAPSLATSTYQLALEFAGNLSGEKIPEMLSKQALELFQIVIVIERTNELTLTVS